ncbi:MAG: hypothetical protein ACREJC_04335, partial [Tepidisphaeraceae bacterium]
GNLAGGASTSATSRESDSWDPATVKPMLEHYLGAALVTIDVEYQAYIHHVASQYGKPDDSR